MDESGRVYVGAVGEIGYLAPDARGVARFVSLKDRLPAGAQAFSDVWVTRATAQGVLFQTREFLFLFQGEKVQVIPATTTFHVAFVARNRIFVRQRKVGLQELKDGRLSLVPGGERFSDESLFALLPLGETRRTGGEDGRLLLGSRGIGFWLLDREGLHRFPTEADAYLKENALYGGAVLADGTLGLATIKGGVVLMDDKGHLLGILDRSSGLQGDNVKALYPDRDGGLWLALDNGISRVEWPSPLTLFDERSGLRGTIWAMQRFQGRVYAATGQGAFLLDDPRRGDLDPRLTFKPIKGVATQSLAFLAVENRLLLASSQGLFDVRGDQARLIRPSSNVAMSLLQSRKRPWVVFLGMQGALVPLVVAQGVDRLTEGPPVPGVTDDVYSMAEDEAGRLWLGTGSQGVLRLTFTDEGPGRPLHLARMERFGTVQGLPNAVQPIVFAWRGLVLTATQAGLLAFDEGAGRFLPDTRFAALFPEGPRAIKVVRVDEWSRIWLDTQDEMRGTHETGVAASRADGSLEWQAAPYRRFADASIESIQVDPSGVAWFGGSAGIMRFDPALARPAGQSYPPLIRRVLENGTEVFGGDMAPPAQASEGPVLPFRKRALRFEFAYPAFDLEVPAQYQVRLEGYDRDWSPWTSEAQKEYTNLPEGHYRFQVRARYGSNQVSPEQSFFLQIRPPWYRTPWAYLGLALGGGALVVAASGLWHRLLQRRNRMLQMRIDQAVEDLRDRERMLAKQAGALEQMNSQLIELNEQKSQFLAIVAHDLRNPLCSILLTSQLLADEKNPEVIRRRVETIAQEGEAMEALLERFLDGSALSSGQISVEPGHLSIPILLESLLWRHGASAQAKGIRLVQDLDSSGPRIFADPKFVAGVLDNLISNAIKFSPPGATVTIRVETHEETVRILVRDQGPGLTEADQQRLFGRFARLSAQPTGGEKSVGLGLSIAKQMVEACGGRIWAESEAGKGATFIVAFPRLESALEG
jgi:signal transduction histidine kinase